MRKGRQLSYSSYAIVLKETMPMSIVTQPTAKSVPSMVKDIKTVRTARRKKKLLRCISR